MPTVDTDTQDSLPLPAPPISDGVAPPDEDLSEVALLRPVA